MGSNGVGWGGTKKVQVWVGWVVKRCIYYPRLYRRRTFFGSQCMFGILPDFVAYIAVSSLI